MKLEHGEDWNLETLIKLLKVEIKTRECVQTKGSNRGTFSVENKRPNYGKNNPLTGAALYTSEGPGKHTGLQILLWKTSFSRLPRGHKLTTEEKHFETCRQVFSLFTKVRAHSSRL